jgi:hypothetical protein
MRSGLVVVLLLKVHGVVGARLREWQWPAAPQDNLAHVWALRHHCYNMERMPYKPQLAVGKPPRKHGAKKKQKWPT